MTTVSVIVPTQRSARLHIALESLLETTPRDELELVVVVDGPYPRCWEIALPLCDKVIYRSVSGGAPRAWNEGAAIAVGEHFVLGADDVRFHPGWYEAALAAMDALGGFGLVGFNDMSPVPGRATHYMVSRTYAVKEMGGVIIPPCYDHNRSDHEMQLRAEARGAYVWAEDARVEHEHFDWQKAAFDDVYAKSRLKLAEDRALFDERVDAEFPNTWRPSFGLG